MNDLNCPIATSAFTRASWCLIIGSVKRASWPRVWRRRCTHRSAGREQVEFWKSMLQERQPQSHRATEERNQNSTSLSFCVSVAKNQFQSFPRRIYFQSHACPAKYIRSGDIYQVNLSQRLASPWSASGWELFTRLLAVSPAPFAAYLDCGDFQIASSSPEQFLRMSGARIATRRSRQFAPFLRRDAGRATRLRTPDQRQRNSRNS